ncbi:hypothetical protein ACUXAV_005795 [Cupriavidus metallidurans]|jgi:hypothetical protein|uniref:Uncharacterized protein n=1 Tax=Cupriavidus metallidurans (strain ATCC 43123 / DSM 2839 / NBRC 102507 / CH34) TaxID=266264 RepID=Q5NV28_CUPMC|nr:hypothetical protein [Cupriavidus metallidurans]HBD33216.1 hypothetical protein [Cupriavidus sp.]ABF13131.1 hypothetical protein Rmet_6272 [Cupriavidus metallidurans CH34]MDE4922924.1 hypothetical protein [Cupriavidus metallidurans]QGS27419.1 hypothetical protein FOB83_00285 [Cupriavidus metallidurans]CAI30184.1 hypothetical protein RMe0038 [Cupriavidus metallidurans CH34]
MPKAIAFFPWVAINGARSFGALRLIPYELGKAPGDLPYATQADIEAVLGAYAEHPRHPIRAATLVEFGDWQTGMDIEDRAQWLWALQKLVAFAALANRRLFTVAYTNTDTYKLVIQRYRAGEANRFGFHTRRRDGKGLHSWGTDEFAFHRPHHVSRSWFSIDEHLLCALMPDMPPHWRSAIEDYCAANTDSRDMPDHTEAVLLYCAFEWLFGFSNNCKKFIDALDRTFPYHADMQGNGPLADDWKGKYQHVTRPLTAWASEFCQVRGQSAHGLSREVRRFVWPVHTHLAFASMLFPLAFKKTLADAGRFEISEGDLQRMRQIDAYVLHDPFAFDFTMETEDNKHPWCELDTEHTLRAMIEQSMREVMVGKSPGADTEA